MQYLREELEKETPGFTEDTYFLLDNASYHTSEETQAAMKSLGLKVIQSGPYSYSAAPIEKLFRDLKKGELNPEGLPTGKR